MNVIIAAWMDPRMDTFLVETWDASLDQVDIFDYYIKSKSVYGSKVLAKTEDYTAFTDGTRVHLTLHAIKQSSELSLIHNEFDELMESV